MAKQTAAPQRRFSTADEVYLTSTGFEVYMISGGIFVFLFTAAFLFSIKIHQAWLIWPGSVIAVVATFIALKVFERREYNNKLRELEAEYAAKEAQTP